MATNFINPPQETKKKFDFLVDFYDIRFSLIPEAAKILGLKEGAEMQPFAAMIMALLDIKGNEHSVFFNESDCYFGENYIEIFYRGDRTVSDGKIIFYNDFTFKCEQRVNAVKYTKLLIKLLKD